MNLIEEWRRAAAERTTRRWFLRQCGVGLAGVAATHLLQSEARAAAGRNPLAAKPAPLPAKAKAVIFMFQAGGPSHLELFDPKPELAARDGQRPPAELLKNYRSAFINPNSALLGPKFKFQPYGRSGIELSELIPHVGGLADELCFIRSMRSADARGLGTLWFGLARRKPSWLCRIEQRARHQRRRQQLGQRISSDYLQRDSFSFERRSDPLSVESPRAG